MITYGKKIESLAVYKNRDGKQNYVYGLGWVLWGEEDGVGASIAMYTEIPSQDGEFVPYENLTEEILLGWVDQYTPAGHVANGQATVETRIREKQTKGIIPPYWVVLEQQQMMQHLQAATDQPG